MAIQSSVNALMQQLYTIGAISAGLGEHKKQTKAAVASAPSFEERYRKAYNIDKNTPLNFEQKMAVKYGESTQSRGIIINPDQAEAWVKRQIMRGKALGQEKIDVIEEKTSPTSGTIRTRVVPYQREVPAVKNEIASDLARGSVEARTASINQTKSDFNAHTASLIKEYAKGSGRP